MEGAGKPQTRCFSTDLSLVRTHCSSGGDARARGRLDTVDAGSACDTRPEPTSRVRMGDVVRDDRSGAASEYQAPPFKRPSGVDNLAPPASALLPLAATAPAGATAASISAGGAPPVLTGLEPALDAVAAAAPASLAPAASASVSRRLLLPLLPPLVADRMSNSHLRRCCRR